MKIVEATLNKFYNFTTRSQLNRRMVGSAIALILFGAIFLIGNSVFNAVQDNIARAERQQDIERVQKAPASDYVNFYQVTVADAAIGEVPDLTLCRKLAHGTVTIDAVRTFIQFADGQQRQVSIRNFSAAVEQSVTNTDCTTLPLQGQPQVLGQYQIVTEYCFKEPKYDIKKCDNYRSNKYKMTDSLNQLRSEIERLQTEYDRLLNGGAIDPTPINTLTQPQQGETQSSPAPQQNSSQNQSAAAPSNSQGADKSGQNQAPAGSGGIVIDLPLLPPIVIGG